MLNMLVKKKMEVLEKCTQCKRENVTILKDYTCYKKTCYRKTI